MVPKNQNEIPTIRDNTTIGIRLPITAWWGILSVLVVGAFGAGCWATWMTVQIDALRDSVTEIKQDIKSIKSQDHISKFP